VGGLGFERQIPQFIHDEQLGLPVMRETLLKPSLSVGLPQSRHQSGGAGAQHRKASGDGLATQGPSQMHFAHSGRAQQEKRIAMGDPASCGQFPDLFCIDRGLGREVKPIQGANKWKRSMGRSPVVP